MSVPLQRSVFIGLGGTGQRTLLNLKKRLLETYGEIPAAVGLLCFDTDASEALADQHGGLTLAADEFMHVTHRNPRPLLRVPEIADWWIPGNRAHPVTHGSAGVRRRGRLALFANAVEVRSRMEHGLTTPHA